MIVQLQCAEAFALQCFTVNYAIEFWCINIHTCTVDCAGMSLFLLMKGVVATSKPFRLSICTESLLS